MYAAVKSKDINK